MGGEGSGRHKDPVNVYTPQRTGVASIGGAQFELPNLSGLQAVKITDAAIPLKSYVETLSGAVATLSGAVNSIDTKGDLLTYSGAIFSLPVGSNNQVLTADSTVGAGIKWAAAAGGPTIVIADSNPMSAEFGSSSTSFVDITNYSGAVVTTATSTIMAWLGGSSWNSLADKRTTTQLVIDGTATTATTNDNSAADKIVPFMCFGTKTGVTAGTIYAKGQGKVNSGTGNWFGSSTDDRIMIQAVSE